MSNGEKKMTTKTATKGTIEVIRHGQGYTLNVWARNDLGGVRFLCPRTLLELSLIHI